MTDLSGLRQRVSELEWYHTLELAPGVVTPGWFDLRGMPAKMPFPASLQGKRCLDIGTFDGFWAFELERRGAAEVVAIDVLDPLQWDWPGDADRAAVDAIGRRKGRGEGFGVARDALGSKVKRLERSIYQLNPDTDGMFDFVYIGSLLLHLRDPVGALMRARSVCAGQLLLLDAIDLKLTLTHPKAPTASLDAKGRPWWWKPNLAALVRMVEGAGFVVEGKPSRVFMPAGTAQGRTKIGVGTVKVRAGREAIARERIGDPHAAVLARPRTGELP
jgi:tRNA (mo5U34)-methyltransferase